MEMEITTTQPETKWTELPRDVTLIIISKLDPLEILESFQFVCKSWYILSKDPSLWHSFRFHNIDMPELAPKHEKMVRSVVDRSHGALYHLDIEGFGSDSLISYLAARSSQLRCLRLAVCYDISADALIEALRKLKSLEEIELTLCKFPADSTLLIIHACSAVRTFKLNELGSFNPTFACDDEALAIAESMPDVRHLQLIGNSMTNDGLKAIIDRCPHLQSLDLRACFHLDLADLGNSCLARIKDVRLPHDSTEDYSFETTEHDSDFDDMYVDEYEAVDFGSDNDSYEFSDGNEDFW